MSEASLTEIKGSIRTVLRRDGEKARWSLWVALRGPRPGLLSDALREMLEHGEIRYTDDEGRWVALTEGEA